MQQKILNQRYELERKIGEGGMARVYLGRDQRLSRPIAVKVLHPHYSSDANFLGRFHHEAQAAANLRHPNVVDIYDVGQDGDIHYIVMEHVDGRDLKTMILEEGQLPIDQAVSIARAVAEGLEAAHRVGLIHRDVKPQNIIVGSNGQVKITDFGIAKSALSTSATETGVIFGTADYLSPEQARGQPATVASDIYSLGVTLYEMLTGRLPFSGDSSIAVAMQHVTEDPAPPRMYNPRIPPQLEALVLRALSKDPSQRPASAREFAQLLGNYQNIGDQATVVRPVAPRPPVRPAPRERVPVGGPEPQRQPMREPQRQQRGTPTTTFSTSRTTLPPRPAVSAPPAQNRGIGLGGVVLGLLLIGGVLGLIALFQSGAFNGLLNLQTGSGSNPFVPTQGAVGATDAAATTGPTVAPTSEATPVPLKVVPNVIGQSPEQATQLIQQAGLTPRADPPRNSDTVPEGQVLDQGPRATTLITETSVVTYAVSLGPELVSVPDVTNTPQGSAQAVLQGAGFVVQAQTVQNDLDKGFVVRQSPSAGLRVPRGSTVTIAVSDGNQVAVPDIYLKPEAQARQLLAQAGLNASVNCQGPEQIPNYDQLQPGTVVSFEPRAGTPVRRGSTVNLGVRSPCQDQ